MKHREYVAIYKNEMLCTIFETSHIVNVSLFTEDNIKHFFFSRYDFNKEYFTELDLSDKLTFEILQLFVIGLNVLYKDFDGKYY